MRFLVWHLMILRSYLFLYIGDKNIFYNSNFFIYNAILLLLNLIYTNVPFCWLLLIDDGLCLPIYVVCLSLEINLLNSFIRLCLNFDPNQQYKRKLIEEFNTKHIWFIAVRGHNQLGISFWTMPSFTHCL